MSAQGSRDGVERLRLAFLKLVAFELVVGLAAAALLVGYFALHRAWCLPAFAAALAAAAAAQVAFIGLFRKSYSGGA